MKRRGEPRSARAFLVGALCCALVLIGLSSPASADPLLPGEGNWSTAGTAAFEQANPAVVRLADGRFLLAGGQGDEYEARAQIYNPATETFTQIASMHTARLGPIGVLLNDGRVVVHGGWNNGCLGDAEIYNPATNSWSVLAEGAGVGPRGESFRLADGRVLIVGVGDCNGSAFIDPATGLVSAGGPFGTTEGSGVAKLADGRILLAGSGRDGLRQSSYIFDPVSDQVHEAGQLLGPRHFHLKNTLIALPDGRALAVGGVSFNGYLSTAEIFDPVTETWSATEGFVLGEQIAGTALLPDGTVLVVGSYNGHAAIFNPATDTWRTTSSMLPGVTFADGYRADATSVVFLAGDDGSTSPRDRTASRYRLGEEPEPTVPAAPTLNGMERNPTNLFFSWQQTSDGGRPLLYWEVRQVSGPPVSGSDWTPRNDYRASFSANGLDSAAQYGFEVRGVNELGEGAWLTIDPVRTPIRPSAPVNVRLEGTVVRWDPPVSPGDGPVYEYAVVRNNTDVFTGITATEWNDTLIQPGQTFTWKVYARNLAGYGTPATLTATRPVEPPAAPTALTVTDRQSTSVSLSWTAPTNTGGGAITGYRVYRGGATGPMSLVGTSTSTSFTNNGLTAGTSYRYAVSAVNSGGEGAQSAPVAVTTPTLLPIGGGGCIGPICL